MGRCITYIPHGSAFHQQWHSQTQSQRGPGVQSIFHLLSSINNNPCCPWSIACTPSSLPSQDTGHIGMALDTQMWPLASSATPCPNWHSTLHGASGVQVERSSSKLTPAQVGSPKTRCGPDRCSPLVCSSPPPTACSPHPHAASDLMLGVCLTRATLLSFALLLLPSIPTLLCLHGLT